MKWFKYFGIALLVIVLDHTLKLWVFFDHPNWPYNSFGDHELNIFGDWFRLHYLLNPGMAFGIQWDNEFGKLTLTLFRLVAMVLIVVYLMRSIKQKAHTAFLVSIALILGGAVGNVIDSTFYGVFLDNALPDVPTPWFHGQVIDMLFFPLFEFSLPQWIPMWGGERFLFFSPVFNIADSSIFIGVTMIVIFQKRFFNAGKESDKNTGSEVLLTPNEAVSSAHCTIDALPQEVFNAFASKEIFSRWQMSPVGNEELIDFDFSEQGIWSVADHEGNEFRTFKYLTIEQDQRVIWEDQSSPHFRLEFLIAPAAENKALVHCNMTANGVDSEHDLETFKTLSEDFLSRLDAELSKGKDNDK